MPNVLIADRSGREQWRLEGYVPHDEFRTELERALAPGNLTSKHWPESEGQCEQIHDSGPKGWHAPEALYPRDVSHYGATRERAPLTKVAANLQERFPGNEWTVKASVWLPGSSAVDEIFLAQGAERANGFHRAGLDLSWILTSGDPSDHVVASDETLCAGSLPVDLAGV